MRSAQTPATGVSRTLVAWIAYDMGAHGYTLIVSGVGFPLYFAAHVAAGRANADMLWAIALGLPLLAAGLLGPWVGALADATGRRRALLAGMTLACGVATAILAMVEAGMVVLGIAVFAVAHATHLLATSLYNSYLPLIAPRSRLARVSGLAWGLSYLGSVACFLLCLPFTRYGLTGGNAGTFALAFPITALFLLGVALPAVAALPGHMPNASATITDAPYRRILATVRSWRHDRNVPTLLLAYYLVNDGVVTAVFFTALTLRKTYGMEVQEILLLSLLLQLVAIPATIFFGWLGGRWSQRGALYIALALWIGVLALIATASAGSGAIAVALALGIVLGSTQSLFRSLFASVVPPDRASEYFGFHTLVGRASAALGPVGFGVVSAVTGSQRIAMASLAVFFVAGGIVLAYVRTPVR